MEFISMDKRFMISKILIRHFIFLLLFGSIIELSWSFGFDSANSCTPNGKVSRRGRAQMLAAIPCDLTQQAYCNLPGAIYPWHAVRRFVHENQGLMKRMYGDVRHISVLRDEIQNNEIDIEDVEIAAERYSRDAHRRVAKFATNREDSVVLKNTNNNNNNNNNDVLTEPHFRPVSTTTTTSSPRASTITTATATATTTETTAMPTLVTTPGGVMTTVDEPPLITTTTISETTTTEETIDDDEDDNDDNGIEEGHEAVASNDSLKVTAPNRSNNNANLNQNHTNININALNNVNIEAVAQSTEFEKSTQATTTIRNEMKTLHTLKKKKPLEDGGNFESNSVYQLPTTSDALLIGDNIEIIESPQLGNTNETASTISTTLKVATLTQLHAEETNNAAVIAQKHKRPQHLNRYRPSASPSSSAALQRKRPQQHQQQQLEKISSSILKESSNFKLQLNESERIPSTSSLMVKGTTAAAAAATATTTATASTAAVTKTTQKSHTYRQGNKNKNNHNNSPTESTASSSLSPSSSSASLSSLSSSSSSSSSSFSFASLLLPLKSNIDPLSNEKLRKPTTQTTTTTTTATKPVLRDGQLFQDTLKQETPPHMNLRGVNACPVKEEVVAPFWANNTRGEVLALLNLYPFEQYVHWEKCTHEHKQMFCRDGCRCEQQYRLHRLLAYDPHNECRGIFSDWFRFPSCCICKCYNIPTDFRATSRSPRSESSVGNDATSIRHPIELAEEQVKRAIYEHATDDWYRPKDEFDFFDG